MGQTAPAGVQLDDDKALPLAPPAPSGDEQVRFLETARESSLRYTNNLPDFLCTQLVSRYLGSETGVPKLHDTLEMSVGYNAKREQYKLEKIDGSPTTRSLRSAGGFQAHGEFGSLLRSIFRPEAEAEFRWQRWTSVRGRVAHVYSFAITQSHSSYKINWATFSRQYHMTAGLRGFVFVDAESKQVLRIVAEAVGIPNNWPIRRNYSTLDYGYVEIAGTQYLLPARVESYVSAKSGQHRNVSEFSHYRRFAGDATITFDADTP